MTNINQQREWGDEKKVFTEIILKQVRHPNGWVFSEVDDELCKLLDTAYARGLKDAMEEIKKTKVVEYHNEKELKRLSPNQIYLAGQMRILTFLQAKIKEYE